MHQRHDWECRPRFNPPIPAKIFPMVKSEEGWGFKSCSCQIQFSKYPFEQVSLRGNSNGASLGKSEQKKKRAKISSRKSEQKKKRSPLIPHCVNLEKSGCSSSRRKMRRREKKKKERVEASFESSVLCVWKIYKKLSNNIVNINIAVVELKNTDFRWSKRDGPLWAVHI